MSFELEKVETLRAFFAHHSLTIVGKDLHFAQAQAALNADQLNGHILADQRTRTQKCLCCAFIWEIEICGCCCCCCFPFKLKENPLATSFHCANSFPCGRHSPTVPGYQAHNGFRCRSKLLLPTRISTSCSGGFPQQPRVVIRTTRMVCGASRSTFHHGDTSFCVSEHFCSSGFSLPSLPSLARLAGPARVADD